MDITQLCNVKGTIFNIQHFCIHDGPGIRCTVFFKGCQYACLWCHNPEGISGSRQISFVKNKCALCGECAKIFPEAHVFSDGVHTVCHDKITGELLSKSACACITKALTVVGDEITAGEVLEQVKRDRKFYDESGGGVTFSGGEPTLQKDFLTALLKLASNEEIHTALETNGHCDFEYYKSIMPYVDLFLIDYKETDPVKHREYTGVDNGLVKENIEKLHNAGAQILLRCTVIPGLNDRDDHFEGIARMTVQYPNLLGAEILPYHKLAAAKADRFGTAAQPEYIQPFDATVEKWREKVTAFGGKIVRM